MILNRPRLPAEIFELCLVDSRGERQEQDGRDSGTDDFAGEKLPPR